MTRQFGPDFREVLRRSWRCPCDGESHRGLAPVSHQAADSVRRMSEGIAQLTGHDCQACPWFALFDPLVDEVQQIVTLAREGLGASAMGSDPPAILIDAVRVYLRAYNATTAHDAEQERKRLEAANKG